MLAKQAIPKQALYHLIYTSTLMIKVEMYFEVHNL
jgi:hypothetical protein